MSIIKFLFDVVVTRLSCPDENVDDPNKYQVEIVFNKISIPITSSRINVSDFNAAKRLEFGIEPERLRENLENGGMPIYIRYGSKMIGNAKMEFPANVIDKIDIGMNDLMHADTCKIMHKNQHVGTVELLCRITIKCDEPVIDLDREPQTCADLQNAINKQDIMFLLGHPDPCARTINCNISSPEEGDEVLRLDIERYRSRNSRANLTDAVEQENSGIKACYGLRRVTENYSNVIDSVTRRIQELEPLFRMNVEPFENPAPSPSTYPKMDRIIPIPVGDIEKRGIKPIRYCPICLFAISWLPKYACCPNCGAKPMPVMNENSQDKLTADQVLTEMFIKPKPKMGAGDFCVDPCLEKMNEECPDFGNDECEPSRCTCKGGKMCAHCRIRKLCEDIFATKNEVDHCEKAEPKSEEDFCVIANSEADCRPYLVRVFSELRDLYNINDTNKASELKARCTKSLMAMKSRNLSVNDDPTLGGKTQKAASTGSISNRLNNRFTPKLGHKTCVDKNKFVSRRHGWNWPTSPEARNYGWRPGAIARQTSNVMRFFLDHESHRSANRVCKKVMQQHRQREKQPPVLNISKKNGEIFVTLRALPVLGVKQQPIIFKIVKSDMAKALRHIRRSLKEKGFAKCTCHQTIRLCTCRGIQQKQMLQRTLDRECRKYRMPSCADHLILTDTSESEMEYNFNVTPPAGTRKPPPITTRTTNRATQTSRSQKKYKKTDPIMHNPYHRSFDCAVGDRFMGTAFGALGEKVFEDGVFGYSGGGQHGKTKPPRNPIIWGPKTGAPLRFNNKTKSFAGKAWQGLSAKIIHRMRKNAKMM